MNYDTPTVYAVKHSDEAIRAASRSGGIFTALSDQILSEGGVIYGCVLDEQFHVKHIRAESAAERDRMRGSKYVQSDLGDTFRQVKQDLGSGKKVLFSGTSCQTAGLRGYLGKEFDGLICVDIVCHGVPSPLVFRDYVEWQQQQEHSAVASFDFRNKADFGWKTHVETIRFQNGKKKDTRQYTTMFYGHTILRPCCYQCPYKSTMHPSEITIADYWGIDQAAPGFNDNKGVSLVLINNDKGSRLFEQVQHMLQVKQTRLEDSMQPPLKAPFPRPANRAQFWQDYQQKGFDYIIRKYGTVSFLSKVKRKLKKLLGGAK